jgi:hypothetical protein
MDDITHTSFDVYCQLIWEINEAIDDGAVNFGQTTLCLALL